MQPIKVGKDDPIYDPPYEPIQYRGGSVYTKPQGQYSNHPAYKKQDDYDWVKKKYDQSNI